MKIIQAREERFPIGDNDVLVYSHDSITEPGHIVRVMVGSTELVMIADTRGEALSELAEFCNLLSRNLRKMAFEQEGAIRLHDYKERK